MVATKGFKPQYEALGNRVGNSLNAVNHLFKTQRMDTYERPEESLLDNLEDHCEFSDYWQNFKRAGPLLFNLIADKFKPLQDARNRSAIDELISIKKILTTMHWKLREGSTDIDVVKFAIATKMLEHKLEILTKLNFEVENEEENISSFNIIGGPIGGEKDEDSGEFYE